MKFFTQNKFRFIMRKIFVFLLVSVSLILFNTPINIIQADELPNDELSKNEVYLGGFPVGFSINEKGATIIGFTDVISVDGVFSPAKDSGLYVGDKIIAIDGITVSSVSEIEKLCSKGDLLFLTIEREDNLLLKQITPILSIDGNYKLGIYLKDSIRGLGTATFIYNNTLAMLGHPILSENEKYIKINGGLLYDCDISGVIKSEKGKAGELKGNLNSNLIIGKINTNIYSGLYGTINKNFNVDKLEKIEIGTPQMGKAYIYTTISGKTPEKYEISIVKIDENPLVKNYVIKINDEKLLNLSNGIVQGMSGSPIIQNNKLIGAVTHVFLLDPTRGYGISISNMLNNI